MNGRILIDLKSFSGISVKYISGSFDMSKVRPHSLAYVGEERDNKMTRSVGGCNKLGRR